MTKLPEPFNTDFAAIRKYLKHRVSMIRNGDPIKLIEFPHEPLIEKALEYDKISLYMFDDFLNLVMHIPFMSRSDANDVILPLADRFALTGDDSLASTKEFIKAAKFRLLVAKPEEYVSIFSIFLFGGPQLMGGFDVDATGAVAFALQLSDWNILDYNDYMLDIALEL